MSRRGARRAAPVLLAMAVAAAACAGGTRAPAGGMGSPRAAKGPPVGLRVVEGLHYPPLRFTPPELEEFRLSNGVRVIFIHDATLPLVSVFVDMKGGYEYFDRSRYAAASALLPLMRNGGTVSLPPDSVDRIVEFNALSMSASEDGTRMVLGVSGLRRQLDLALSVWSDILLHPRFDSAAVERWRAAEMDAVRRTSDFPGTLAVIELNHLLYGDHPTGWIMNQRDLAPDRTTPARFAELHDRVVCPQTAVIGAAGAVKRSDLEGALERALSGWRPCREELRDPAPPVLRVDPRTYIIPKRLTQSTIVLGEPGGIRLRDDPDYFASRIANWVIGEGGFGSRLLTRLRTEKGLAYSAASIWGAARDHERILGAITYTRSDRTVEALRVVEQTLDSARTDPPDSAEVELAREDILNGFVFGFSDAVQIVARQVRYMAEGFPSDWPDRFLRGVREVRQRDVARVIDKYLDPRGFTILIVGDTSRFDLSRLGPYTILGDPAAPSGDPVGEASIRMPSSFRPSRRTHVVSNPKLARCARHTPRHGLRRLGLYRRGPGTVP